MRWGMEAKVLGKMGALIKARTMLYEEIVQAVVLYRSEIWLVTGAMMTVMEGLHHSI